jgi:histidyl-tRNA synthetase
MSQNKPTRPEARLPRGFRDRDAGDIAAERRMLDIIRGVYDRYGFAALETPVFEYTDALGKFLPDTDRPNEGVFSLQDDDGQWLSLRYDLTAPLARYAAQNFQNLPKPFRRYQIGTVFRNEKPGPGRFREFTQCDADTVGSASPASDAELLMMLADVLEAVGLSRGDYAIKVNSRKVLDGVLDAANVAPEKRGAVLRAIDKVDRLGLDGMRALLGEGRKDESGDFTKGAGLSTETIHFLIRFMTTPPRDMAPEKLLHWWSLVAPGVAENNPGNMGMAELAAIFRILGANGYTDRITVDPGIVRGLDYYTGPVFEAVLTGSVTNEAGEDVVFGAVGAGGRYDDLVARFTGQSVPATGVSIGVSRLLAVLHRKGSVAYAPEPLIVVLVLDKAEAAESFALARELRDQGFRAECYVGDGGMKAQLKYADKRGAAAAIIEGSDERVRGEVTVKDLVLGAELAKAVESRGDWVKDRPAQRSVPRAQMAAELRAILAAHGPDR